MESSQSTATNAPFCGYHRQQKLTKRQRQYDKKKMTTAATINDSKDNNDNDSNDNDDNDNN